MVIIKLHKIINYVYTEKIINDRYFKYKIDKAQSYFPSVEIFLILLLGLYF